MALATFGGLQSFPGGEQAFGSSLSSSAARGSITFGQKAFLTPTVQSGPSGSFNARALGGNRQSALVASAQALELDQRSIAKGQRYSVPNALPVVEHGFAASGSLPGALFRLLDPNASVDFPPANKVAGRGLNNRELDKLVSSLGRSKATWRRALLLHDWLLSIGHHPDDRLCTTLIRVCSQHGQSLLALNIYEWMRTNVAEGGGGLRPTVYTYTAAMRAALAGNLIDRALKVWDNAVAAGCETDSRMCTTLLEVCTRKGDTARALAIYSRMRDAPPGSRLAPSVHAFTSAMRAAADGGAWERALEIWNDMIAAGCQPTGHAYAAAISACAVGSLWKRAVELFDEMLEVNIKPDVVSCTALISALGSDAQWERAERVIVWMHQNGVKPNVRTYTALITALGNAKQWKRALNILEAMKHDTSGNHVEPNAYTYSALLKALGEHGQWGIAEKLFSELEAEVIDVEDSQDIFELDKSSSPDWATPPPSTQAAPANSSSSSHAAYDGRFQHTAGMNGISHVESAVQHASSSGRGVEALEESMRADMQLSGGCRNSTDSNSSYGDMPMAMAEQVLASSPPKHDSAAALLPDDLPGQAHSSSPASSSTAAGEPFSLFAAPPAPPPPASSGMSLLQRPNHHSIGVLRDPQEMSNVVPGAKWGLEMRGNEHRSKAPGRAPRPASARMAMNEVVCGAMMLAYERAGKWDEALGVLRRAKHMGIEPNTIMYNTAMSALAKSGHADAAEMLFGDIPEPDSVSYETLIAAYGMAGEPAKAESVMTAMEGAGYSPRDYAYCGLIAAYSMKGNWSKALQVRQRMVRRGMQPTVHVYNALLAACERAQQWDKGIELQRMMSREGVQPNTMTRQLLLEIGRGGISQVADQQVTAAALTAAVAAAGSIMIRAGAF